MKTSLQIRIGITAAVLIVAATPLLFVRADTRSERRVLQPAPLLVSAPTVQTTHPAAPLGGIISNTSGIVSTGENTGGAVTTGDEQLDVVEVNIGPTNNPPPPTITPTPTPVPSTCDTRRSSDCAAQDGARIR